MDIGARMEMRWDACGDGYQMWRVRPNDGGNVMCVPCGSDGRRIAYTVQYVHVVLSSCLVLSQTRWGVDGGDGMRGIEGGLSSHVSPRPV